MEPVVNHNGSLQAFENADIVHSRLPMHTHIDGRLAAWKVIFNIRPDQICQEEELRLKNRLLLHCRLQS